MKEFIKKNMKLLLILFVVIAVSVIGITFAYSWNNSVTITAGQYDVIYTGENYISFDEYYLLSPLSIYPEDDGVYNSEIDDMLDEAALVDKAAIKIDFTVKGAQNVSDDIYDVSLTNLNIPDDLKSKHLKWRLIKNNSVVFNGNFSSEFDVQIDNRMVLTDIQQDLPDKNTTADSYTFYIWISDPYIASIEEATEDDDLSSLRGKTMSGKISIEVSTGTPIILDRITIDEYSDNAIDTIEMLGLENYVVGYNDEVNDTIYKSIDDLGISYYFKGDVNNNYVKFDDVYKEEYMDEYYSYDIYCDATSVKEFDTLEKCETALSNYSGCSCSEEYHSGEDYIYYDFIWRIIRINGDGTVRIILESINGSDGSKKYTIGTSNFNESPFNSGVGYMNGYPYSSNYKQAHVNIYDSSVKLFLDNWYRDYLNEYVSMFIADAIYCNDRSLSEGVGYYDNATVYRANNLLNGGKPLLTCYNKNDRFTLKNSTLETFDKEGTNQSLTYPIGLITADEFLLATDGVSGDSYFSNIDGYDRYLLTMTPSEFISESDSDFYDAAILSLADGVLRVISSTTYYDLTPVISLKVDDAVTWFTDSETNKGTINNPFQIKLVS